LFDGRVKASDSTLRVYGPAWSEASEHVLCQSTRTTNAAGPGTIVPGHFPEGV